MQRLHEVMGKLDNSFKPKLNEEFGAIEGRPFEPIQLIRKAMTSRLISPDEYFSNTQQMEGVAEEIADQYSVPDGHGFGSSDMTAALKSFLDGMGYQTDYVDGRLTRLDKPEMNEEDEWIQKAVDPEHKGYCTPMTKDTCTPRRKALAKRFKAGIEDESIMEAFVGDDPEEYRGMVERLKASMDKLFQEEHFDVIDTLYRLIVERKRPLANAPQIAEENVGGSNALNIGHNIYKEVKTLIDSRAGEGHWNAGAENAMYFYGKVLDGISDAMYQDLADSINTNAGAAPDEMV